MVHLELYTEYSIKYGMTDIEEVLDACKNDHHTAAAITDYHNIFAWVKFYHQARKRGIQPICGMRVDIYQKPGISVLLLCANNRGYEQLLYYTTLSNTSGLQGRWLEEWLDRAHISGLWVLALPGDGTCTTYTTFWKNIHTKLHNQLVFTIQRSGKIYDINNITQQFELAHTLQCAVVATHPICFMHEDDFEAHEVRTCIQEGYHVDDNSRPHLFTPQQHWLSQDSFSQLFIDTPQALRHTSMLASHCHVSLEQGVYHLPVITSHDAMDPKIYLTMLAEQGLTTRFTKKKPHNNIDVYTERLHYELNIINSMGFASYFLIVCDFIQWAKKQHIPVGPGRGSGAGSLVSYALGITDLDPLEYQLLFERFLNPERISMPDFDIDFCMIERDKVIHYVQERYGKDCVSQIITYGTMTAKAVIRDVGRALGHPYGFIDSIAKLIPLELGITLEDALEQEPSLKERYQNDEEITQLIDIAKKLEGKVRNVGRHAGGVVIAPEPLSHFSPLYIDDITQMPMTQFDKDDLEKIGLVKFDFLGLRTLTLIHWAVETLKNKNILLDVETLPVDDPATYTMLTRGDTVGVFQLESSGMRDLVIRLAPNCFEDLIALVALYRPGPLQSGMVDDFIARKFGADINYMHPLCESILKPTYGVIVYQEQVMQIAQVIAGYTLGNADLLRRAMGKKNIEEMNAQRNIFIQGAEKNKLSAKVSGELFDLIEKFAGYGFNKSHSAAYALLSYQTAYIKCHHPDAFMAAVLSSEIDHPDKLVSYAREVMRMKIQLLPPCVLHSSVLFSVTEHGSIRYGLSAIKGVGTDFATKLSTDTALKNIHDARTWVEYVYTTYKPSRKTLEALVRSGAMDILCQDRGSLWASIDRYIASYNAHLPKIDDLFANFGVEVDDHWLVHQPWTKQEKILMEQSVLGWSMSGHICSLYRQEASSLGAIRIHALQQHTEGAWVMATIHTARRIMLRNGRRACFWTLEDDSGSLEVGVYDDKIKTWRHLEETPVPLLLRVSIRIHKQGRRYTLENVLTFDDMRLMQPPQIHITLPTLLSYDITHKIHTILKAHPGATRVHWHWQKDSRDISWTHGTLAISQDVLNMVELLDCRYAIEYSTVL